jgi:hypothetical protein
MNVCLVAASFTQREAHSFLAGKKGPASQAVAVTSDPAAAIILINFEVMGR